MCVCVCVCVCVLTVNWMCLFFDGFIFQSKHHCCSVSQGGSLTADSSSSLHPSAERQQERGREREGGEKGGGSQFVLSVCVGAGQ